MVEFEVADKVSVQIQKIGCFAFEMPLQTVPGTGFVTEECTKYTIEGFAKEIVSFSSIFVLVFIKMVFAQYKTKK